MATRNEIIKAARSWLKTPWKHQGRSSAGIDCAGLIVKVAQELDIPVEDRTDYQRRTQGLQFLEHFRKNLDSKPLGSIQPGDVIVMREPAYPCHCGIITEKNGELYFIHSYVKRRRVVEEHLDANWHAKIIEVFSYKDLED